MGAPAENLEPNVSARDADTDAAKHSTESAALEPSLADVADLAQAAEAAVHKMAMAAGLLAYEFKESGAADRLSEAAWATNAAVGVLARDFEATGTARKLSEAARVTTAALGVLARDFEESGAANKFRESICITTAAVGVLGRELEESGVAQKAWDAIERTNAAAGVLARDFEQSGAARKFRESIYMTTAAVGVLGRELEESGVARKAWDAIQRTDAAFGGLTDALGKSGLIEAATKFEQQMASADRFRSSLDMFTDPLSDLDKFERSLDPMRDFDLGWMNFSGTSKLDVLDRALLDRSALGEWPAFLRPPSITILRRSPKFNVRCKLCRETVQADLASDGVLEVFFPCPCGGLALEVARDLADASPNVQRPLLTVLRGGRPESAGSGESTGQLRVVVSHADEQE